MRLNAKATSLTEKEMTARQRPGLTLKAFVVSFQFQNRNEDESNSDAEAAGSRTSVRESSKKKAYPVDPPPAYLQADLFSQMEVRNDKFSYLSDADALVKHSKGMGVQALALVETVSRDQPPQFGSK